MNLHGIAAPILGVVNPLVSVTIQASGGYTTQPDGTQVPVMSEPLAALAQIQALTYADLQKIDGLNIQGERRAIYLAGQWHGVVRADQSGGDLITLPDGTIWLAVLVLESWPDWTKLAVTRQVA